MKSNDVLFVQINVSKYILTVLFSMDILAEPEILFCYRGFNFIIFLVPCWKIRSDRFMEMLFAFFFFWGGGIQIHLALIAPRHSTSNG